MGLLDAPARATGSHTSSTGSDVPSAPTTASSRQADAASGAGNLNDATSSDASLRPPLASAAAMWSIARCFDPVSGTFSRGVVVRGAWASIVCPAGNDDSGLPLSVRLGDHSSRHDHHDDASADRARAPGSLTHPGRHDGDSGSASDVESEPLAMPVTGSVGPSHRDGTVRMAHWQPPSQAEASTGKAASTSVTSSIKLNTDRIIVLCRVVHHGG